MQEYVAHNMEFIGYHDLDGKPGFKMAMQSQKDRRYLYLTHLWEPGWTILEVTDPAHPKKRAYIPGPDNTWTLQVQVADQKMLTSLEKIPPAWGGNPDASCEEGIYLWDVSDPVNPKRLSHFRTQGTGTHRNYYEGGRYAHLAAGMPGFEGNIYVVLDIDDPEKPCEVARWFLPEQYLAGGGKPRRQPFLGLHGPAYVEGERAYLGYGLGGMVILDISNVRRPSLVSQLEFGAGIGSNMVGIHTVVPYKKRNLAVLNTEALEEECNEALNFAGIVEIQDEANPRLISLFPLPEPPIKAPYPNFSKRGGRFGPHNQHHYQNHPDLLFRDDLIYLTYFNAGLRVFDISDPYLPKETGYFIPPDPSERRGLLPETLVAQTEDVLVDSRGYAFITDKNLGLYVVRYTGDT
jgi:hypothetical protein